MKMSFRFLSILGCLVTMSRPTGAAPADSGVSKDKILVGRVTALSGISSGRPLEKKMGSDLYFNKINAAGGVNGRKIEIKEYDDKYEPELTAKLAQKLIDDDHVFCLFAPYGTAPSQALVPIVTKAGVPTLFPSSGSESLRKPVVKVIYNIRPSSFMEVEALLNYALDVLAIKDVAFFHQNDFYGVTVKAAATRASALRHVTFVAEGSHSRDSTDVAVAVDTIKKKDAHAVLLLSLFLPSSKFITLAKEKNYAPVYLAAQSVLTEDFIESVRGAAPRIFVTQDLPPIDQPGVPIVKQFRDEMSAYGQKTPSLTMFEGYFEAAVFVEGLKRASADLSRSSFLAAMDGMANVDIGGIRVNFSETNHQGLDHVYVSELKIPAKAPAAK